MDGPSHTVPIISKSDIFTDGEDGTKITKSKTISFRGQQRTTLLKFGSKFVFEEFIDKDGEVKDGVFKLIPVIKDDTVTDSQKLTEEELILDEISQDQFEDDLATMLEENTDSDSILPFC